MLKLTIKLKSTDVYCGHTKNVEDKLNKYNSSSGVKFLCKEKNSDSLNNISNIDIRENNSHNQEHFTNGNSDHLFMKRVNFHDDINGVENMNGMNDINDINYLDDTNNKAEIFGFDEYDKLKKYDKIRNISGDNIKNNIKKIDNIESQLNDRYIINNTENKIKCKNRKKIESKKQNYKGLYVYVKSNIK